MSEMERPARWSDRDRANVVNLPSKRNVNLRKILHRLPGRHPILDLPLFRWTALPDVPPFTPGGRWVHRRTGLSATVANVIAELAGIGRERDR